MATYENMKKNAPLILIFLGRGITFLGKKKSFLWHLLKHLLHHNFLVTLSGDIKDTGKSRNSCFSTPFPSPCIKKDTVSVCLSGVYHPFLVPTHKNTKYEKGLHRLRHPDLNLLQPLLQVQTNRFN